MHEYCHFLTRQTNNVTTTNQNCKPFSILKLFVKYKQLLQTEQLV